MMYYRLALQERQAATLVWKSTPLTSLGAVLQLLRIYSFIPQNRIRVFISATKEGLDDMLNRENDGLASESVTAAEFLHARNIHIYGTVQSMQDRETMELAKSAGSAETTKNVTRKLLPVSLSLCEDEDMESICSSDEHAMSLLDRKRLEIERGEGGDHDVPYVFTLPFSIPQVRAWTRLLSKVQAGKLQS